MKYNGEVPERSKGADCKSVGSAFEGSNPSLPIFQGVEMSCISAPFFLERMLPEVFYENGLRFSCQRCSRCCRHEPGFVYLSRNDLTNLCRWFNLEEDVFIRTYCRWVPYYDGTDVLCLQEKLGYDCVLWDGECTAYAARPLQCSVYPFWSFLLENETAWNDEAASCPGINRGELHGKEEIEKKLAGYRNNTVIRKMK